MAVSLVKRASSQDQFQDVSIQTETTPLLESFSESSAAPFDSWPQQRLQSLERTVVSQIDLRLMPLLILLYILNYLDRNNIASARLGSLEGDLELTERQYDTCVSVLYIGYISMQVPSNFILSRVPRPAYYLCGCMAVWGVLSTCTAFTRSFSGLLVSRFLLGFVESAFFPGATFYISSWYTKKEQAIRAAFLFSGSQIGNAFGNLIAVGLLKLDGILGVEGWRWLYLVEGTVTIGVALFSMFILPDLPSSSKPSYLTPMEHNFAIWRLQQDVAPRTSVEDGGTVKVPQGAVANADEEKLSVWEALRIVLGDAKTWMFVGILMSNYTASGVTHFFPSVVQTLGYSRTITLLLAAPPYLLCCLVMVFNGMHSDRTQERYKHVVYPLVVTVLAHILVLSTTATAPRYLAMMVLPASVYAAAVITMMWMSQTLGQKPETRAVAIAFLNAISNTANIWTPYLYNHPPRYVLAFSVNIIAASLSIAFATLARQYLKGLNEAEEKEGRKGRFVL